MALLGPLGKVEFFGFFFFVVWFVVLGFFVCLFFSETKGCLWIQLLLYLYLQHPGFSRQHGSFGLHLRRACLGFYSFEVPWIYWNHPNDPASLVCSVIPCFSENNTFNSCSVRSSISLCFILRCYAVDLYFAGTVCWGMILAVGAKTVPGPCEIMAFLYNFEPPPIK